MDRHTNIQIAVPSDRLHDRKKPDFSPAAMTGNAVKHIAARNMDHAERCARFLRHAVCTAPGSKSQNCGIAHCVATGTKRFHPD
jgi:hypothetical protein